MAIVEHKKGEPAGGLYLGLAGYCNAYWAEDGWHDTETGDCVPAPEIKFPCKVKFTIHTYTNTTRTAVFDAKDEKHLNQLIDFYMSDTTGQTKSVTHAFYVGKKQP